MSTDEKYDEKENSDRIKDFIQNILELDNPPVVWPYKDNREINRRKRERQGRGKKKEIR